MNIEPQSKPARQKTLTTGPYFGFFSKIARETDTTPGHVYRVFRGHTTSKPVSRAIQRDFFRQGKVAGKTKEQIDAEIATWKTAQKNGRAA
jgi:hypothetical protein